MSADRMTPTQGFTVPNSISCTALLNVCRYSVRLTQFPDKTVSTPNPACGPSMVVNSPEAWNLVQAQPAVTNIIVDGVTRKPSLPRIEADQPSLRNSSCGPPNETFDLISCQFPSASIPPTHRGESMVL